jgi:hypothetical protein
VDAVELRPYQRAAAALEAWEAADRRGIAVLPTGSGKTRVAIAAMARSGLRSLCMVPTCALMEQWLEVLAQFYGGPIGRFGDGEHDEQAITVITFESAYRHMNRLGNRFDLIVVDEVHHFGNGQRDEALEMAVAPARLGLTATPRRDDAVAERLSTLVGPPFFEAGIPDLSGTYLARFHRVTIDVDLNVAERRLYEDRMAQFRAVYDRFRTRRGPNVEATAELARRLHPVPVVASGGIATLAHLTALAKARRARLRGGAGRLHRRVHRARGHRRRGRNALADLISGFGWGQPTHAIAAEKATRRLISPWGLACFGADGAGTCVAPSPRRPTRWQEKTMRARTTRLLTALAMLLSTLLLGDSRAHAYSNGNGTVTNIVITTVGGTGGHGVALIYLSGDHNEAPACHTQGKRWAADLGLNGGQAVYSMALAAQLSGRPISMVGAGNCNAWGDTETILYAIN